VINSIAVMPAEAGIQVLNSPPGHAFLDPGVRRDDGFRNCLEAISKKVSM
jgi:hypothetical protein